MGWRATGYRHIMGFSDHEARVFGRMNVLLGVSGLIWIMVLAPASYFLMIANHQFIWWVPVSFLAVSLLWLGVMVLLPGIVARYFRRRRNGNS